MKFYKKVGYGLPALIMAGAIFYVSSLEKIELPLNLISFNDLLFHAAAYFFFGITLMIAAYPWNISIRPLFPTGRAALAISWLIVLE